jgi:hypothetical protein
MKIKILNMPFSYDGKEYKEGEIFEVPDKFIEALERTPAVKFEVVSGDKIDGKKIQ